MSNEMKLTRRGSIAAMVGTIFSPFIKDNSMPNRSVPSPFPPSPTDYPTETKLAYDPMHRLKRIDELKRIISGDLLDWQKERIKENNNPTWYEEIETMKSPSKSFKVLMRNHKIEEAQKYQYIQSAIKELAELTKLENIMGLKS